MILTTGDRSGESSLQLAANVHKSACSWLGATRWRSSARTNPGLGVRQVGLQNVRRGQKTGGWLQLDVVRLCSVDHILTIAGCFWCWNALRAPHECFDLVLI